MSKSLLLDLNGNKKGVFHNWLNAFDGEPRIAWYPSSGIDFHDLLYLSSEYSKFNPASKNEPNAPDIFIHTDYFPWKRSSFLDNRTVYEDEHTTITVKSIEELPQCEKSFDETIICTDERNEATDKVIFLEINVQSDILGSFTVPLIYAFVENSFFCAKKLIPLQGQISHIVHVRYGGGLGGGGRSTGVWLLNVLQKLKCEIYITDSHGSRSSTDEYIYEKYPALAGDEDESTLDRIRVMQGEKWSSHGAVSWNLLKKN